MKYKSIKEGVFISRPNRFVANVDIDGITHVVHVKNTGRCKELLIEGVTVYLEDFGEDMRNRKTRFSLVAVKKISERTLLINMDSQAPNKVVAEALKNGKIILPNFLESFTNIQAEKTLGDSRFDFFVEGIKKQAFIEVKGVTLENRGIARFPDAPTERGVKHIRGLMKASEEGFLTYIIFVIQMKGANLFQPNDDTHLEFGRALREAKAKGVHILAYDCNVTLDTLEISEAVSYQL